MQTTNAFNATHQVNPKMVKHPSCAVYCTETESHKNTHSLKMLWNKELKCASFCVMDRSGGRWKNSFFSSTDDRGIN